MSLKPVLDFALTRPEELRWNSAKFTIKNTGATEIEKMFVQIVGLDADGKAVYEVTSGGSPIIPPGEMVFMDNWMPTSTWGYTESTQLPGPIHEWKFLFMGVGKK